jgi:hypothetical protein
MGIKFFLTLEDSDNLILLAFSIIAALCSSITEAQNPAHHYHGILYYLMIESQMMHGYNNIGGYYTYFRESLYC